MTGETVPPWAQTLLDAIIGPVGAIVVLCLAIFFLWRLFREEQKENRSNFITVSTLSDVIKEMNVELRAWREAKR